jgi:hypothetical protein
MRENIEKNGLKNDMKPAKIREEKFREKMSVQFCIQGRRGNFFRPQHIIFLWRRCSVTLSADFSGRGRLWSTETCQPSSGSGPGNMVKRYRKSLKKNRKEMEIGKRAQRAYVMKVKLSLFSAVRCTYIVCIVWIRNC